jgi:hypothetical protein
MTEIKKNDRLVQKWSGRGASELNKKKKISEPEPAMGIIQSAQQSGGTMRKTNQPRACCNNQRPNIHGIRAWEEELFFLKKKKSSMKKCLKI